MRSRVLLLILLLTIPTTGAASAATGVEARGPDEQGAFDLVFDLARDAEGSSTLALEVNATDDAGATTQGRRDLGARTFPAGTTRWNVSFLPAEGVGDYVVRLLVDGLAQASLSFRVDRDATGARLVFDVPDEPTEVALTSDTVNADGKLKSPGETVTTRGTVRDGNGVAELDRVAQRLYSPEGALVEETTLALDVAANGTSAAFEGRLARSPLAAGTYRVQVAALKRGVEAASVQRTFIAREVAPVLLAGAAQNVTPDEASRQALGVVLGDRNGAPGEGRLEARVYRGSTRAEGLGVAAAFPDGSNETALSSGARLADADGYGRTAYDLALDVPARAPAGSYRVSLYTGGALLASLPFEVRALPALTNVTVTPAGSALHVNATGTGDGLLRVALADGKGASTTLVVPFQAGRATASLDAPSRERALSWNATLLAREGGPGVDWREGTWQRPGDGPALEVTPPRAGARLPATWRVAAPGWDLASAQASVRLTRWDGAAATGIQANYTDGRVTLTAPPTLEAGRYHAALVLTFPNGTSSEASWSFEAGPWVRVQLGEANVTGREARLAVANTGGLTVDRLVAEAHPESAQVALVVDGQERAGSPVGKGRWSFPGLGLAPGEEAQLVVRLPAGPLPAGARPVEIRLLAQPGAP